MNEEHTIDRPRECCDQNYDHFSVPNGDTDSLHKHPLRGGDGVAKGKTYIRSTIKNEAAAWVRYEGNYRREIRALRVISSLTSKT